MDWLDWVQTALIEMEIYLFKSMNRNLKRHLREELLEQRQWTQWQAIQLQSIWKFRREYSESVNVVFRQIIPEAEKQVEAAFHKAVDDYETIRDEATRAGAVEPVEMRPQIITVDVSPSPKIIIPVQIEAQIETPGDESFFQINRPKLDAVISDVRRDMDVARYGAAQRMGSMHEEIIKKADLFFQTGTMTLDQAVEKAALEAASKGLNCIEYENGRRVNVATYAEMALRTSSRRAALTAEGAKRDEFKEYLVISPTLHSTCDTCQIWQGKVLVDDVFASGKPDGKHSLLSEAIEPPSHFLGPNCRHPLVTYYEGFTEIPKSSPYDQTKENYQAEQRQRQIELMIRKYKRLRESAFEPETIEKYEKKVAEWQDRMHEHLEANPQLRRKPQRERLLA